jgi:ABC-type sugar transport system ATPase subunit
MSEVQFSGITKRFPGVVALDNVSLVVRRGSCHGLVGENGAGKSTLGKILAGIHQPDEGHVRVGESRVRFATPRDALAAGVAMVHQELAFCENMSVAENLCLGRLPQCALWVRRGCLRQEATRRLTAIGATSIDPSRPLGELPVAEQQMVQIAAAVGSGARILIFDEPTSSLSEVESRRLLELIGRLRGEGVTSIYVSHRLEEVFRVCDTVTVLRDGRIVETRAAGEWDEASLVATMIGRPFEAYFPGHLAATPGEELLRVEGLSSPGKFQDVSLTLRAGEIVGLAGLVGAGRTQLAEALFGLDRAARGRVLLRGEPVSIRRPGDALALGIGLIPEDRKRHGLILPMSAVANISMPILERLARLGWVMRGRERTMARGFFDRMSVRAPGLDTAVAALSGGNQQKIVLAKWLAAQCRVLLVDEPTRGVDVGAKAEIHALIDELARQGSAILLISSELPEVINLSTRILALRNGRIVGETPRAEATQETLLRWMAGVGTAA